MRQDKELRELEKTILGFHPKSDFSMVEEAYYFSKKAHESQLRKSGKPYFSHPCAVAMHLAEKGLDDVVVSAALLHDVIEDNPKMGKDIKALFGKEVHNLVDAVTKIKAKKLRTKQDESVAAIMKIFEASSKDLRALVIKLYDKLHNLRTIGYLPKTTQKRVAMDALSIYVPLAHKLGIHELKYEMEDICFKVLEPKKYGQLKKMAVKKISEKRLDIRKMIKLMKKKFPKFRCEFREYRKSMYTIYSKMASQNKQFRETNDCLILKIIVKDVPACYDCLGKIHSAFKPIPRKIKDFIAIPEFPEHHTYRSIHTQVIGPSNTPIKVYIFSSDMNELSREGVIALMRNTGKNGELIKTYSGFFSKAMPPRVRGMEEFEDSLNLSTHENPMLVFTTEGEPVNLPNESTALDFAFFQSPQKAKRAARAKINGKITPLWKKLSTGDRVKIIHSSTKLLKPGWLYYANTNKARRAIEKGLRKRLVTRKTIFAKLRVDAVDRPGLLSEQTRIMARNGLDLETCVCKVNDDHTTAFTEFSLSKGNTKKIEGAVKELKKIKETLNVTVEYV